MPMFTGRKSVRYRWAVLTEQKCDMDVLEESAGASHLCFLPPSLSPTPLIFEAW